MKKPISLKKLISIGFITLGLVIVIGYSLLSMHFFIRGMDNIVAGNMENAALTFIASRREFDANGHAYFRGNMVSSDWQSQPETIQQAFERPTDASVLMKHNPADWFERPDVMYFVMQVEVDNEKVYISRTIKAENVSTMVGKNMAESLQMLLLFSAIIAITMIALVWLILRHISRPVSKLGRWTHALSAENLQKPVPDFMYPELNEMANLIHRSLCSVQQSLEREHQFLRYTSHELRTPISVIRNNIELLNKLQSQPQPENATMRKDIADRIDRASRNMHYLTETLLWLSREQDVPLPVNTFALDGLITQLCEEMRYLLKDKQVSISIETIDYQCTASEVACRIVLGNLIRNAYQHTWEGRVIIRQDANTVIIHNQQQTMEHDNGQASGFGLGLQLTAQLTTKLSWRYENQPTHNGHHVTLTIKNSPPDAVNKTA
ncbi:sensor histidine kinase [Methylophaga sp. OBS3]|uniref:sensor histidine kinase n=1 Tax=Methylophaga sp. OBS3 TaxID=2991934 RepID=UPI002256311A|nr:HAMP domain-containing sensor histidine kinase [Methylophaga sp. OBS3]MCX4190086.1 HAMP domain-containing histidine kinase [Methylophaga sp. OBS3]